MADRPEIVIVGGGIGGLTLSLALARHGLASIILEQRAEFSELGAGIQLGPNAVRILSNLGIADELRSQAFIPERITIGQGRSGRRLTTLPLKSYMEERFGSPYVTMRRVDLQRMLLTHAHENDLITIRTGFRLDRTSTTERHVVAINHSDEEVSGTVLVGADGIWSRMRQVMFPATNLRFSGKTAWRALIPMEEIPEITDMNGIGLWLGANGHLVHYPVRSDAGPDHNLLNVVAIIRDPSEDNRWSQPADIRELIPHFNGWSPTPRILIDKVTDWHKWSLFDSAPLKQWQRGRMCLLGDAAHPMLPFLAQGGAMAIEDAASLAECIQADADNIELALKTYEAQRSPRANRVQAASRRNGRIYHMKRPMSRLRDLVISTTSPKRLLKRYDWLYGFSESGG